MRHRIETRITIDAPPETVWAVLVDLDRYCEWNPFIVESSGRVAVGERLTNRMSRPGGNTMVFGPTVTEVEPGRVFEWLGRLGLPGLFDGRHRFELQPNEDGTTTVRHSEYFSGILVRSMKKTLDTDTVAAFEAMNEALAARVADRVRCGS